MADSLNTMKHENLFSKQGSYSFVVESNALLHQNAINTGIQIMASLQSVLSAKPVAKVLDLACGGEPITISRMLAHLADQQFSYTGIDINPDQISAADSFRFPDNVITTRLIEGSAWELEHHSLDNDYDIIFIGMNLHHGTPEEIHFLIAQIKQHLAPSGVFINHDWYRPDNQPYLRRPDHHHAMPGESFVLVDRKKILPAAEKLVKDEISGKPIDQPWHKIYTEALCQRMSEGGVSNAAVQSTADHVYTRDYPVSVAELENIFRLHQLNYRTLLLRDENILSDYIVMPVASPSAQIIDHLSD